VKGRVNRELIRELSRLFKRRVEILSGFSSSGSLWRFIFNYLSGEKRKIIQFGLDAGFGELNSLGFGFINLVK